MATKKRPWFPGACYHITNRGNHKEKIFIDDQDYKMYIHILKNTLEFYKESNYKLISYCLMSNHVHLLIKTNIKDPSYLMRRLNSLYVRYFNQKYNYVGHLFQERYFSNIITSDYELLEVSKYIHLNPVKANLVNYPENYKWSSFRKIISNKNPLPTTLYVHSDEILSILDIYFILKNSTISPDYQNYISKSYTSKNYNSKISHTNDKKQKYKSYVYSSFAPEANPKA